MQDQQITKERSPDALAPQTEPAFRVVIAYDDPIAGQRALRVLADVATVLGETFELQPLPWSFNLLADVDWRDVAASDAVKADFLMVVTADSQPLPRPGGWWAEGEDHRKRGTPSAVVALFAPEDGRDATGFRRREALEGAARRAGFASFAPALWNAQDEYVARVHLRAEMVTPVLEGILERSSVPPDP